MSDLPIKSMNFKQLRNEVQYLRDELAMMKRHYDDLLYNLDDDNIVSVSADKVKGLVVDSITTDSLYAEYGDIADLTVDHISTSKKVRKYLLSDMTDDTFFEGYDQSIDFVQGAVEFETDPETGEVIIDEDTGEPAAKTVQLTNRYGEYLWWNGTIARFANGYFLDDEGNILLDENGDPVAVDGNAYDTSAKKLRITPKYKAGYSPVIVYRYTNHKKLSIAFYAKTETVTDASGEAVTDEQGNAVTKVVMTPRICLGVGTDATGATYAGRAFIEKTDSGIDIQYYSENGALLRALRLADDGAYQIRGEVSDRIPVLRYYETEYDAQTDETLAEGDFAAIKAVV